VLPRRRPKCRKHDAIKRLTKVKEAQRDEEGGGGRKRDEEAGGGRRTSASPPLHCEIRRAEKCDPYNI